MAILKEDSKINKSTGLEAIATEPFVDEKIQEIEFPVSSVNGKSGDQSGAVTINSDDIPNEALSLGSTVTAALATLNTNKADRSGDNATGNLLDAIDKRHDHANKAILDATQESFTTTLKTKLDGVATNATKNQTDTYLLNRVNHTGTQDISTINELQTSLSGLQTNIDNKVDKIAGKELILTTDIAKLSGIATGATKNATDAQLRARSSHTGEQAISTITGLQTDLDNKVDKSGTKVLSDQNYTLGEKQKLASLESSKFKGQYLTYAELVLGAETEVGAYAYVDGGSGSVVAKYIWDSSDNKWELVQGETTEETPASIKSKYESNVDTNAYTDADKSKLASITAIFTTALKSAYDTAAAWVTTNGANLLAHLTNTSNPHEVTKAQVLLGNVDNTSDINKPISTAQGLAINAKPDLGETSTTAYRGDRGLVAYDHSQTAHAPADAQKNSDITKAEIEAKLTGAITTHSHPAAQVTESSTKRFVTDAEKSTWNGKADFGTGNTQVRNNQQLDARYLQSELGRYAAVQDWTAGTTLSTAHENTLNIVSGYGTSVIVNSAVSNFIPIGASVYFLMITSDDSVMLAVQAGVKVNDIANALSIQGSCVVRLTKIKSNEWIASKQEI